MTGKELLEKLQELPEETLNLPIAFRNSRESSEIVHYIAVRELTVVTAYTATLNTDKREKLIALL